MGVFEDIKYGRKAVVITQEYSKKSDDELNNILFDLRTKYKVSDDDFIRMNTCISLITAKKMSAQLNGGK